MTTLPHDFPARPAPRLPETQAVDNYVLATRTVHRAETLLAAAERFPEAILHIEAAMDAALCLTADSTWADVHVARQHLDAAQDLLDESSYRIF